MCYTKTFRKRPSCEQRRFYVSPLHNEEFAKRFASHVSQLLGDVWDEQADGQTQWSAIRDSMLQTLVRSNLTGFLLQRVPSDL